MSICKITKIEAKAPGNYHSNGTGRDTYIGFNNGGLSKRFV